jgi:predicted nucleic acid-binding protein
MNDAKVFVDTNIFVYLYSDSEFEKQQIARNFLNLYDRAISTQVLNEFCNVCIRKLNISVSDIKEVVSEICKTCEVLTVNEDIIYSALDLNEKYGYSYYDSLIIASALNGGCEYLITEDLADGQVINGKLTIKNIFS